MELLMEEAGVPLMEPRNLDAQMGEYKAIARRDQQLSIFDRIIIEMCGECCDFLCW